MGSPTGGAGAGRQRGRGLGFVLPLFAALLALLAAAPAAQATFHLIKVREVFPGANQNSYVELQMFAPAQNLLSGHSLTVYNPAGALVHSSTFSAGVANSQNQSTILIGDSNVESSLGVKPDLLDSGLSVPATGGAVCWNAGGIPADCVAWGNFTGGASLQSATGTSAGAVASPGGIGAGKALRRTIAPGCSTLLEESDDTNSSLADFAEVTPAPRNDASAIVETTCPGVPNTAIDDRPPPQAKSADAEFTYDSPTASSFECSLDGATFAVCPNAGQEYTGLADGVHSFQVRGVNSSGPDPTPASYAWTVDTVAPVATIDTHPVDPSPGASASFGFHADEAASFECSLVATGSPDSYSACEKVGAQTYTGLADGDYTFKVRATDQATNLGAPASFAWTVDHLAPDTTPPLTTIVARPPDPSPSATVSFGYESNEPGSTFQCSLDGAAFAPCPSAGITYSGLADGAHSFQVRAVDPSANVDPTPAGFSFSVAAAPPGGGSPGAGPTGGTPPAATPSGPPAPPARPAPAAAPPQTILAGKPGAKTHDRTPTFRFRSDAGAVAFECAVDGQPFKACRSPFTTKRLKPGSHVFAVRARAGAGTDASPAKFSFKVLGKG